MEEEQNLKSRSIDDIFGTDATAAATSPYYIIICLSLVATGVIIITLTPTIVCSFECVQRACRIKVHTLHNIIYYNVRNGTADAGTTWRAFQSDCHAGAGAGWRLESCTEDNGCATRGVNGAGTRRFRGVRRADDGDEGSKGYV